LFNGWYFHIDTPDARRSLRQNLEMQSVENAKKFLQEMDTIRANITSVEELSFQLQDSCIKLASKVEDADRNMKDFIERASFLETKKSQLMQQSSNVNDFLVKYHMKQDEIELLRSANLNIHSQARAFFATLHRLKEAYADCQSMTEKHFHGTIGFELLEILGQHQDTAYLHLFEWVKQKCESVGNSNNATQESILSDDAHDVNLILQMAIRQLQDIPIYFSQCQELLVQARRNQLIQKFILVLTQGDAASMKSALDLQSYDAIGYIGAMLAWVHQAMAMEQEFLYAILHQDREKTESGNSHNSVQSTPSTRHPSSASNSNTTNIQEILVKVIHGLGRPLKMRLSQTLENNNTLETLYAIADLLTFYQSMFYKILPQTENIIYQTVTNCLTDCRKFFSNVLHKQAESLQKVTSTSCQDLKVSVVTRECARQIVGILIAHDHSLSTISTNEADNLYVDVVLGDIIQPLLQACRLAGLQSLSNIEMAVYMLNNVMFLQVNLFFKNILFSIIFSIICCVCRMKSRKLEVLRKVHHLAHKPPNRIGYNY
jgi:hypothetical protein